jgi:hypothetical protein
MGGRNHLPNGQIVYRFIIPHYIRFSRYLQENFPAASGGVQPCSRVWDRWKHSKSHIFVHMFSYKMPYTMYIYIIWGLALAFASPRKQDLLSTREPSPCLDFCWVSSPCMMLIWIWVKIGYPNNWMILDVNILKSRLKSVVLQVFKFDPWPFTYSSSCLVIPPILLLTRPGRVICLPIILGRVTSEIARPGRTGDAGYCKPWWIMGLCHR